MMSEPGEEFADQGAALLELYDAALPQVYGYLLRRCDGSQAVAEDLTSETFMAAVDSVQGNRVPSISVAWLIGVARHKLADHWRRQARDTTLLSAFKDGPRPTHDDWDARLDAMAAHSVLAELAPQYRAALTLRYFDGLAVKDVARHLDRTPGATDVLLLRARRAFRTAYEATHHEREEDR